MSIRYTIYVALLTVMMTATNSQADLIAHPTEFKLVYNTSLQRLVVLSTTDAQTSEITAEVTYAVADPSIVRVDEFGVVRPLGDGTTAITISHPDGQTEVSVQVSESDKSAPVSFELDVQPILAARGCSAGACHGKQRGQNGFQLSLLGFDSNFDFNALTREGRGRRVFPAAPQQSLLLTKPAGQVPHGGGERLPVDGVDYNTILRWINDGMPRSIPDEPTLSGVTVFPELRDMRPNESQQLVVTAHYSNGSSRDVTGQTAFQSNESAIVGVDDLGVVTAGPIAGEATIMARFMGAIATTKVLIPLAGDVPDSEYEKLPVKNFIDELVWEKLKRLRITPSGTCSDSTYIRRVYVDIIGRLPTPDETREFINSEAADKRDVLVDQLLQMPEYGDHWANKWVDLLRPNPYRVGIKAVLNYDNWIRTAFRENRPYDEFVYQLVTAQGSTWRNGAVTLFRDRRSPDEITTLISQLFLGIRLDCAKCHHHPFERWSQEDFYSLAAFFADVGRKGTGLSPPISGGEEMIITNASPGSVSHPLTNEVLSPRPLFGEFERQEVETKRESLARWMTDGNNPYFSQVMANRVWEDMMGRGIVSPVDDLRATNPPSNAPLLAALGDYFRDKQFNIKELIAVIAKSHVYELSSEPNDRNVADNRNYSRHYRSRLRAEVLLDAVSDITAVPESFSAMVNGSRANQIWTHRVSNLFLDTFGRPDPNQDPPCERTGESTVTQVLHLMNSPNLHAKVTEEKNKLTEWIEAELPVDELIDRIYLSCYSRHPDDQELTICRGVFATDGTTQRQAAQDIMWALINTPEFMFKD